MAAPITIDWEEQDVHLAFDGSKVFLAAPQLIDGVYTDARIASIAWLPAAGFDIFGPVDPEQGPRGAAQVPTTEATVGHGSWPVRHFDLEHGCTYELRLTPAGRAALQLRGPIRYAEMFERLGGGHGLKPDAPGNQQIHRLSTAFYTRVFERGGPSFRGAFADKVSGVEEAAANQAKWFAGCAKQRGYVAAAVTDGGSEIFSLIRYWGAMASAMTAMVRNRPKISRQSSCTDAVDVAVAVALSRARTCRSAKCRACC